MAKRLTTDRIGKIQALCDTGLSYREIGEILGVHYTVVSYALRPEAREQKRLYGATYRQTHKKEKHLYHQTYRKDHKKEILLYNETYRKTHKEQIHLYRETHKEQTRLYSAAYGKEHKAELSAKGSARRARINGSTTGNHAQIVEIYRIAAEEPKVRCYLCNKLIPLGDRHVDHILPVCKGGETRPSNLAVTCSTCNFRKGPKHPNEIGILI